MHCGPKFKIPIKLELQVEVGSVLHRRSFLSIQSSLGRSQLICGVNFGITSLLREIVLVDRTGKPQTHKVSQGEMNDCVYSSFYRSRLFLFLRHFRSFRYSGNLLVNIYKDNSPVSISVSPYKV